MCIRICMYSMYCTCTIEYIYITQLIWCYWKFVFYLWHFVRLNTVGWINTTAHSCQKRFTYSENPIGIRKVWHVSYRQSAFLTTCVHCTLQPWLFHSSCIMLYMCISIECSLTFHTPSMQLNWVHWSICTGMWRTVTTCVALASIKLIYNICTMQDYIPYESIEDIYHAWI